jgi:hypothetical protein
MIQRNSNQQAFFTLLRAGLWEKRIPLFPRGEVDWRAVCRLAEEQSVTGLLAAGLEQVDAHDKELAVPKTDVRPLLVRVLAVEDTNARMNRFIAELFGQLREAGIAPVLVKGQGIAQCHARPLWRACGDVDLLLDAEHYEKAKALLTPIATKVEKESPSEKHLAMTLKPWEVELHGTLRGGVSKRMDAMIDAVQDETCAGGKVRIWNNQGTPVPLPSADNDIIFIFTHFLKHFFKGGIGLRQICDWCRLLWTCRDSIDLALLEKRLRRMRLMSEWKAFAAMAVQDLGMPAEAMPFYDPAVRWKRKARRIRSFILRVGNFGHNRDASYFHTKPFLVRKTISLGRRLADFATHLFIFPLDALRYLPVVLFNGFRAAVKGI